MSHSRPPSNVEDRALAGEVIWGDDFTDEQIAAWFADEEEGYASLGAGEHGDAETYGYHELNKLHGWRHLPPGRRWRALGIGSSYGGEFLPIIDAIDALTVLEPSKALRSDSLRGVPLTYVSPAANGDMPFPDASFDLVVCLGTLHHIPNVSHVIAEIGRVIEKGGYAVIREPIRSMGDWRRPRRGLTARERGLPPRALAAAFDRSGFTVVRQASCVFPTTARLAGRGLGFNSRFGVRLDRVLSLLTQWNDRYHATEKWHKVHPTAIFYVLRKA